MNAHPEKAVKFDINEWPTDFDFETDGICQSALKPFIVDELEKLEIYDSQRPPDITYIFHEHAERVARNIEKTCVHMGLGKIVGRNMYWALLPHDIGKRLLPTQIWDQEEKPDDTMKKLRRTHTELGVKIVNDALGDIAHPFKILMTDIMLNHHEQIDGGGYRHLPGEQLSKPVRLAAIIEAFDGWSIRRPHFGKRDVSVPSVLKRIRDEKAGFFDMELFEAFAEMKMNEYKTFEENRS
jgi:HD-GYP domain-containing protein (c-di-GMP phosphodiesterase class II)